MRNTLKIFVSILFILSLSRFVPHPPNFTSLIALSFYIPIFFGARYILFLVFAFAITDLIIGFHSFMLFTWGSVALIGLLSKYFKISIYSRISGSLLGACLFFIFTNFGFWLMGSYGYSISGLITCYILAIPFFAYTLISTFIFAVVFEFFYKVKKNLFSKTVFN